MDGNGNAGAVEALGVLARERGRAEAAELAYWFGHKPARTIVRQGRIVKGA